MGRRTALLVGAGALFTACALAAAPVVGGFALLGKALLVAVPCLAVLLVLGVVLRSALPAQDRPSAGGSVLWLLTLPMRAVTRSMTVDVLSLQVKEISGAEHRCTVKGRWSPAPPALGDEVEVYGRRDQSGAILVRRLVSTTSGQTTTGRPPPAYFATRMTSLAIIAVWTAAFVGTSWSLVFRN